MMGASREDLHGTREFLLLSKLQDVTILYWYLDPKKSESEEMLAEIRNKRGYSYKENYEEKVKNFFLEHMHADEEIHYCLDGSGYFDVCGKNDKWVKIWIKGDMIVLPAGIYHLFTIDHTTM